MAQTVEAEFGWANTVVMTEGTAVLTNDHCFVVARTAVLAMCAGGRGVSCGGRGERGEEGIHFIAP